MFLFSTNALQPQLNGRSFKKNVKLESGVALIIENVSFWLYESLG
jgi:hypothetical protein